MRRPVVSVRRSIHVAGFSHVNPIPAGCRFGNFLITGAITGLDTTTGKMGATLDEQCANIFGHMREIVTQAGGGPEHIVKVTVWHDGTLSETASRSVLNREWLKMFPDENSRPARHTIKTELEPGRYLVCDMMAILGENSD